MRFAAILLLAVLAALTSGCSPKGYFTDRWADAKDVLTATVGTGGGVKARVGPLQVGLFENSDFAGLRGGAGFYLKDKFSPRIEERTHDFASPIPIPGPCEIWASFEKFDLGAIDGPGRTSVAEERGMYFRAGSAIPFVSIADRPAFFTQIEVAAGIGGTIRLGFNPGELLDFVVGWFGIDIYGDDIEARKKREEAQEWLQAGK